MGRLGGKTAIVVGAGQTAGATIGNGRATAMLFAREGARVLLVDRDDDSVQETLALLEHEAPGAASVFVADIVEESQCEAIVARALEQLDGRIDVLHNNVGIGAGDGGPTSLAADSWDRILDTNLKAMWLTCKHVVPVMRAQGRGAVVNISSIYGRVTTPFTGWYQAAKHGLEGVSDALRMEVAGSGVHVV
ncbi:MAG: hypothetical protein QOF28_538, partial [Actinomycetota bacterium]|nr:hypothetical protein [Actinomycetota bacterium]